MKILLLSAYEAESHRYWRSSLQTMFADAHWTCLILPPRHFHWRIRGNSLSWSQSEAKRLNADYDICIATSMVDLATLRGIVPHLASIPTVLYFHENQFAYPLSNEQSSRLENKNIGRHIEPQMVQLYSALCADRLCFNSAHNQQSFLNGVADLLARMPDGVPVGVPEKLAAKSDVLPVPLLRRELQGSYALQRRGSEQRVIVWNHRWEYDKGPDRLLAFIRQLPKALDLKFHIVGQSFRKKPECFTEIKEVLSQRGWLGTWGYVENRDAYLALVAASDFALSTAIHDFQGLSVLEAIALGCIPLLPNRLAYPEIVGDQFLYPSDDSREREAVQMAATFCGLIENPPGERPDISGFFDQALASPYLTLFETLSAGED